MALWQLWRKVSTLVPSEFKVLKILKTQCLLVSGSLIGLRTFSDSIYLDMVSSRNIWKYWREWGIQSRASGLARDLRTYAGQGDQPQGCSLSNQSDLVSLSNSVDFSEPQFCHL